MKTTKVNRHNCDHCNKRGYSAGHMARHEKRCTANPRRECGMCSLCDETQRPIEELLAALPLPTGWIALIDGADSYGCKTQERHPKYKEWCAQANEGLKRLCDLTECPACILAAIRQRGLAPYCDFEFKKERDAMWANIQDAAANDKSLESTWL